MRLLTVHADVRYLETIMREILAPPSDIGIR